MSKQKLFAVRDFRGKRVSEFTDSKMQAKSWRDQMQLDTGKDFYVTKGPDHIGNHGCKGHKRNQ